LFNAVNFIVNIDGVGVVRHGKQGKGLVLGDLLLSLHTLKSLKGIKFVVLTNREGFPKADEVGVERVVAGIGDVEGVHAQLFLAGPLGPWDHVLLRVLVYLSAAVESYGVETYCFDVVEIVFVSFNCFFKQPWLTAFCSGFVR